MASPPSRRLVHIAHGLVRLKERGEIQALALYLGGAWLVFESTSLVTETFSLPQLVVQSTFAVLAVGAMLVVPIARWYELTARELAKSDRTPGDVPGVPDVFEAVLVGAHRRVDTRVSLVAGTTSMLVFSGLFLVLWSAWAESHERPVTDPRVSVLVFPFRTTGTDDAGYGEGLADLLTVTLDGTPGIQVIDPAAVWRELRTERGAPARAPDPSEAGALSREHAAERYVTGTVVRSGSNLDVTARAHAALDGEVLASLTASAHEDSLATVVDRLAIDLVAAVWDREGLPTVPEIERYATSDAEALKAYLEAKSLKRRGQFQEAQAAIERAVSLDSTFALALMEQFSIRSWVLFLNAEPFIGLRPIIEQAMRHREALTPRNRLRVEAARAMDDTDGQRAAFLLQRILSIDSLDVDALHSLAFLYLRDGWQLGKGLDEITGAYERVIEVDPTSIVARATRATLAMWRSDPEVARRQIQSLQALDTTSRFSRGILGSFRALQAPDSEVADVLGSLATEPAPVVITVLRNLRTVRPALAERFTDELTADSLPVPHQQIGSGARTQLWFAGGRLQAVDSVLTTGALDGIRTLIDLYFVTTWLAGVGDRELTERAVAELTAHVPPESAVAYFEQRAVWPSLWAVGAYHASYGDTARARIWQETLGELPGGGTPLDYRVSLQADIEARLAARRGDLATAEEEGWKAYRNWGIHSGYFQDYHPEVAMRFHLAEVLRETGKIEQATSLYHSFTPPHTWYAFYTARASLELGRIEEAAGEIDDALRHYLAAARLWERGDPAVVGPWLEQARAGLQRLGGERGVESE